eukprot:SAG31_NODE_315_length_17848_cov_18.145811_10_plen_1310_part_00
MCNRLRMVLCRWPLTISKYKARMSPSPDFGFSLAARKIKPDQLATLDLSSWHIAQSGAEPIRLLSMKQFFSKFEPVGFKQESFAPSYGLAEHVLGVQGGYAETMPTLAVQVDKSILRDEKRASIVESGSGAVTIFHVGTTLPQTGVVLLIVDSNTMEPQPDGRVGEIWINSLSKGAGYWRKPESTVEIFEATLADSTGCSSTKFLRTGDLGFKIDRKLYICGRAKDVIIIAGRNYYPNDLEESIDTVGSAVLRPGCAAAFSVQDDTTGAELLVIAIELRDKKGDQNEAISVVQSAVRALHSISVDVVVLLHPRTIPKTTSGKIQRQRCKAAYLDGALSEVSRSSNMLLSSGSSTVVVPTLDTIQWTVADLVDASVVRAKVARAIQEKLKDHLRLTETVDLSSSMVDLGVSSIGMTHLHEDFMQMFGVDSELLPLEVLFEDRSVHDIAVGIAQLVQNECDRREQVHSVSADNQTSSKPSVVESRLMFHLAQTAGSMLILFVGSAALIPAYYFGEAVLYDGLVREPWSMIALWGGTTSNSGADAPSPAVYTFGLLVPFLIPIWIMAFTLAIVLLKWCCVGRYKAGDVPLYSAAHLRWWLIDQLLEFWETWVGYFLSGLFYLNIFYKILGGSKIDASAKISAFLREPDLVSIGAGSSISGRLYTRRFGRSVLHFDRIVVGARCTIKSQSVLTPGCCVGDDTVLEALSAVARGAALDEKSVYSGNPAVRHQDRDAVDDTTESTCNRGRWTRVASKVLIQVCVLVVAFSLSVVSVLFWEAAGIPSFRYGPLLYWVVSFFFSSGTIAICSPIVKWLLIGRVKPGCYDKTLCRDLREWTVNYVYSVATYTFMRPWPSSPVSQFWQKAHGVKIANQALVLHSGCISASEADLVILDDHTFLSACTICCNRDDADGRVVRGSIHLQHGSMVGLFARVGLGPDQESCTLEKGCAVGVLTNFQGGKLAEHQAVFGSITMAHRPNKLAYPSRTSVFFANCAGFLFRLRVIMVHVLALIPAYEFAVACFFGSASEYADTYRAKQFEDVPMPRIVAVMLIAVAYLIYVVVLVFASVLYKRAIFGTRSPGSIKVDRYHDLVKYLEYQALVYMMDPHYSIIRGTMLLNYVFKAFGARIGNGVQIYGRVYEHEMHTIGDDVVLDSCTFLLGHVGQDMGVTFAATCLESGARVEPGAVVWGGDTMSENSVLRSNSKMAAGASLVRGGEYIGVPASRSTGTGTGGRGVWGPPRTSGSNETLSTDLEIQEAPESANVAKSKASTIELSDDKVKLVSIKMQPMTSMGLSWCVHGWPCVLFRSFECCADRF